MDYLFLKKNQQYAHHIFRHFADQYYGDAKQSALLYASYMKCCRGIERKLKDEALAREAGVYDRQTLITPEAKALAIQFNDHCKEAFIHSMSNFQNYSLPMVLPDDRDRYVDLAKVSMRNQWRIQASYRNITPDDPPGLVK
jgi:hypothetical protein